MSRRVRICLICRRNRDDCSISRETFSGRSSASGEVRVAFVYIARKLTVHYDLLQNSESCHKKILKTNFDPTYPLRHCIVSKIIGDENTLVVQSDIIGADHLTLPEIGWAVVTSKKSSMRNARSESTHSRGGTNRMALKDVLVPESPEKWCHARGSPKSLKVAL